MNNHINTNSTATLNLYIGDVTDSIRIFGLTASTYFVTCACLFGFFIGSWQFVIPLILYVICRWGILILESTPSPEYQTIQDHLHLGIKYRVTSSFDVMERIDKAGRSNNLVGLVIPLKQPLLRRALVSHCLHNDYDYVVRNTSGNQLEIHENPGSVVKYVRSGSLYELQPRITDLLARGWLKSNPLTVIKSLLSTTYIQEMTLSTLEADTSHDVEADR